MAETVGFQLRRCAASLRSVHWSTARLHMICTTPPPHSLRVNLREYEEGARVGIRVLGLVPAKFYLISTSTQCNPVLWLG